MSRPCGARFMGVGPPRKKRGRISRNKNKRKIPVDAPEFKDVYRKFMSKVHPDLFTKYPELQETNETSLQSLNEVLQGAKSGVVDSVLKPTRMDLDFFVRTDNDHEFLKVPLRLRLAGGYCKRQAGEQMGALFHKCGLPRVFDWGKDYWYQRIRPASPERKEDGSVDEEAEQRAQAQREAYRQRG